MFYESKEGLNDTELREALAKSLEGKELKHVLILPPDYTRMYSGAGKITEIYYDLLKDRCEVDIMPALGTHEPMTEAECKAFFGSDVPFEKILVHNTTGRIIPAGKLPAEVGVVILNVTTLATLANYVKTGMPLVEKCITVDGSAIKHPKNVLCPIGTSIRDVLDFVDAERDEPGKVIFGGPMTGFPAYSLDEPIVKNTNAITVLTKKDAKEREATACIHCGRCVEACPLSLVPTAFTKALDIENVDERMARLEEYSIMLCMECGCCSFVCPANRPLIQNNRMAKNSLREYNAHRAKLK